MNKNSIIDYSGYILLKLAGPLVRILPKSLSLFLGRFLGDIFYVLDLKHRALAYAHIKTALGSKLSPVQIRKVTRKFYRSFGQNFMEIFFIPQIDSRYIKKYVSITGLQNLEAAFKKGKGVILVAMHAGSWELANIVSANLGFKFSMFVREQKFAHLEKLLNSYRSIKGCRFIQRESQTRQLIRVLKDNESVALTIDQGGKSGRPIEFFHKKASMASGAVELALKLGCSLVPVFPTRINGPYIKVFLEPPFELKKTADSEKDIRDNLQELVHIFERYIEKYPQEYLWTYKIWKYSDEKNILILSDAKAGHLNQAKALGNIVTQYLGRRGIKTNIYTREVRFKNRFSRLAITLSNCLAGKYICQGCLFCLRKFLAKETYADLVRRKFDLIISCGSSLAGINYILAKENLAKSMVIMRPSIFSLKRFDLVVQPEHDSPAARKNIVVIEGALNLIDQPYLSQQSEELKKQAGLDIDPAKLYIGLLIGGNTKDFCLNIDTVKEAVSQIKKAARNFNAEILVSTSRRTKAEIVDLLKNEFQGYPACKLLIIANEKNYPSAVGGILDLSHVVITSAESISMICEAVSSKKFVVVFAATGLKGRHKKFLDDFSAQKYIHLSRSQDLAQTIDLLLIAKPRIKNLNNNAIIEEALKKVL
jgi:KDO2-lipid IV(A) lauroyltransferase